jgi:hypothetical protein
MVYNIHTGTYSVVFHFVIELKSSPTITVLQQGYTVPETNLVKSMNGHDGGGGGFLPCLGVAQSRQSAKLFLQSSELGLLHPFSRRRVCPHPHPLVRGGGHTRLRERGWGCPNSDEGTYTAVLCECGPRGSWDQFFLNYRLLISSSYSLLGISVLSLLFNSFFLSLLHDSIFYLHFSSFHIYNSLTKLWRQHATLLVLLLSFSLQYWLFSTYTTWDYVDQNLPKDISKDILDWKYLPLNLGLLLSAPIQYGTRRTS